MATMTGDDCLTWDAGNTGVENWWADQVLKVPAGTYVRALAFLSGIETGSDTAMAVVRISNFGGTELGTMEGGFPLFNTMPTTYAGVNHDGTVTFTVHCVHASAQVTAMAFVWS